MQDMLSSTMVLTLARLRVPQSDWNCPLNSLMGAIGADHALGETLVESAKLAGHTILVVEDEALIALDLQTSLEAAGAQVVCTRGEQAALAAAQPGLSAAVLDARPGSSDHRTIARRLRKFGVPFLFYATHAPEDVTTVRGAPVLLKPERPEHVADAVALLLKSARRP